MALLIVPSFQDQKKKSSGGGGFSDGGVRSQRLSLSAATTEVGPPPGNAWSGFGQSEDSLGSVQAINFSTNAGCTVNEYFVSADGTERFTGPTLVAAYMLDTLTPAAVQPCSPYLQNGGILAYPNKLRYRLTLGYGDLVLPTGRVLLHFDVAEFDMPKDQEPD
jgi:hypothetical protein